MYINMFFYFEFVTELLRYQKRCRNVTAESGSVIAIVQFTVLMLVLSLKSEGFWQRKPIAKVDKCFNCFLPTITKIPRISKFLLLI
jgi:hypothetical protein